MPGFALQFVSRGKEYVSEQIDTGTSWIEIFIFFRLPPGMIPLVTEIGGHGDIGIKTLEAPRGLVHQPDFLILETGGL